MMTKTLKDLLEHAETWPREDQDELAEFAREIQALPVEFVLPPEVMNCSVLIVVLFDESVCEMSHAVVDQFSVLCVTPHVYRENRDETTKSTLRTVKKEEEKERREELHIQTCIMEDGEKRGTL